jgi:xylose isomerase
MDLFYGHISGMDALARGLRNAARILEARLLPVLALSARRLTSPMLQLTMHA